MKNLSKFLLVSGLLLPGAIKAQNLLSNGDFETGDAPWCMAQANAPVLSHWKSNPITVDDDESIFYENAMHSPDLFQDGVFFNSCGIQPLAGGVGHPRGGAHGGNRSIGMCAYELIQTEIPDLEVGKIYNISMYIQMAKVFPGMHNNTELCISVARNEVHYKEEGPNCYTKICLPDFVDHQDIAGQEIITLKKVSLDPALYYDSSAIVWKRVDVSFRWDESYPANLLHTRMKYLTLEVRKKNYTDPGSTTDDCWEDYVYIDDVVLQKAEFCNSVCSPSLGPIEYSYKPDYSEPQTFANALVSNAIPWVVYVKNAIGIDFTVFSTGAWDDILYKKSAYDPDGLKDVGYDDYEFMWNGDLANGTSLYEDVYGYTIQIWNCDLDNEVTNVSSFMYFCCMSDNTMAADIIDYELEDCCPTNAYFQNITWAGEFRKDVSDFITAGSNVTSGTTGPVIVASTADVKFFADNTINLMPGFSVAAGGQFEAMLQSCRYSPRMERVKERLNMGGIMQEVAPSGAIFKTRLLKNGQIANSYIFNTLGFNKDDLFNLDFYSTDGKPIFSKSSVSNDNIIDLNTLTSGVYLVRVQHNDFNEIHKIIIAH